MYRLLCGHPPFYSEDKYLPYIYQGKFCKSPQWDSISEQAKDLIRKMLNPNPSERISISKIYAHPWMNEREVLNHQLGTEYARRVQSLSLREKLRNIFLKHEFQHNLIASFTRDSSQFEVNNNHTLNHHNIHIHNHNHSSLLFSPSNSITLSTVPIPSLNFQQTSLPRSETSNGNSNTSQNQHHSQRWFDRLDTNKDGAISEKELMEGILEILSEDDHSHSSHNSSNQEENLPRTNRVPSSCPSMRACVQDLFSLIDQNSNGYITFEDFTHFYDLTIQCTVKNLDINDDLAAEEKVEQEQEGKEQQEEREEEQEQQTPTRKRKPTDEAIKEDEDETEKY